MDTADEQHDASHLRVHAAHGVKWSLIQTIGGQVVRLAFTFFLVRLVGPGDFGVIAQSSVYIGLVMLVLDQGFATALVQKRDLEDTDVGTVTWLNLAMGVVLAGATIVIAPQMASFFHTPELTAVLRVLSLSVLLQAFQLVPKAIARRRLLFRSLGVIELVAVLVSGVVAVAAGLLGAGYWALVVQQFTYGVINLVGVNRLVGTARRYRGSFRNLRALWAFSIGLLGSRFLIYFGQNFDNVLIGRYQSARQLAFYALAYRLLDMPLQMIGGVVNQVSLPIFARLQDDDARMCSWFLRATSSVALLAFPVLTLLIVGAPAGVPLIFGEQWVPAVLPLQILCLAGMPTVVRMLMSPLAQAKGRTDTLFWWALVTFGLMGAGFAFGIRFGIVGVAWSYAIVTVVTMPPNIAHFGRMVGLDLRRYWASLLPASASAATLALVWVGVDGVLAGIEAITVPTVARLAVASVAALLAYAAALRLLFPGSLYAAREVATLMGRSKVASGAPAPAVAPDASVTVPLGGT